MKGSQPKFSDLIGQDNARSLHVVGTRLGKLSSLVEAALEKFGVLLAKCVTKNFVIFGQLIECFYVAFKSGVLGIHYWMRNWTQLFSRAGDCDNFFC